MSGTRTGGCLCGAVRFRATDVPDTIAICHCPMCRRWTGSAQIGVMVPEASIAWTGTDHIAERQSSDWAKRAWCRTCGTCLFFRFTDPSVAENRVEIMLGAFDDPNGFQVRSEIFIDHKPDSFAFADGDHAKLTRAEVIERLPVIGSDGPK